MLKYVLRVVAVLLIGYSLVVIGQYFYDYLQVETEIKDLTKQRTNQSFQQLSSEYEEIVGWIDIKDTRLHQPIVQTTNNEFYLTHNYKGEQARTGAIFMDYRNHPHFTDQNTILYGHVLRTGAMFGDLPKYENEQYARTHAEIEIEAANETLVVEIFAAYETTIEDAYLKTHFSTKEFLMYVKDIQAKSAWTSSIVLNEKDQIVTLSTCTTSLNDDERFVVHAKIVERIEKK